MSKVIELAKEAESKIRSADENWTSTKTKFRSATIEGLEWSYKSSKRTILETAQALDRVGEKAQMGALAPMAGILQENQAFVQQYKQKVLTPDTIRQRQQTVAYASAGIAFLSFTLFKRRFLQRTIGNGATAYLIGSYFLCPENLNPF